MSTAAPWYSRIVSPIGAGFGYLARAFGFRGEQTPRIESVSYGAGWEASAPQAPSYAVEQSMSAYAAFPMVRACASAIAEDLAGLPLKIVKGSGEEAKTVEIPELRAILDNPLSIDPTGSGVLWRQQWAIDLLLPGNAYALILLGERSRPVGLLRLHPGHVNVVPSPFGTPAGYVFGANQKKYEPSAVLHARMPSWADTPDGVMGEGLIRVLDRTLSAELAMRERTKQNAAIGAPLVIISAGSDQLRLSQALMSALQSAYMRAAKESRPLVIDQTVKVDSLSLTAQEMQLTEQQARLDVEIMAVFGVPPSRLFSNNANYATAAEQSRGYWESLRKRAAMIDGQLTRVARAFGDDLTIQHDFSSVAVLQDSRTAQINRAVILVEKFGADPASALAYEGLADAPIGPGQTVPEDDETTEEIEPVKVIRALDGEEPRLEQSDYARPPRAWLADLFEKYPKIWRAGGNIRGPEAWALWGEYEGGARSESVLDWVREREAWAARHYQDGAQLRGRTDEATLSEIAGVVAQCKWGVVGALGWPSMRAALRTVADKLEAESEARAASWAEWEMKVRAPAERRLLVSVLAALSEQSGRVLARLSDVADRERPTVDAGLVAKDFVSDLVDEIFPPGVEDQMLREALESAIRSTVETGYRFGIDQIQTGLLFEPSRLSAATRQQVAQMVTAVNSTTRKQIQDAVLTVYEQGGTVNDIQKAIQDSVDFGPSRSLLIARTETCRAVSTGTDSAINQGLLAGVNVRKLWLSARDLHVRDEHMLLDGDEVMPGETFTIPAGPFAGRTAPAPGGFGSPALDCNCRCGLVPSVIEEL